MAANTTIEWATKSWNPVRGCSRVSPGCDECYAMKFAHRFSGPGKPYEGLTVYREKSMKRPGVDWNGVARFIPEALDEPLRWKKPQRIFVNSMSDLFHHSLTNEQIAAVFGVMAACPRHTFQVLTKRPERALEFLSAPETAGRVDTFRHIAAAGRIVEYFAEERIEPIAGWPGYWITSKGRVLSDHRGERRELKPMPGEQGHCRVTLYNGETTARHLVHRLVLAAFEGRPYESIQGCHITGDATCNALWNLRWGTQEENWKDSKRHGTRRRYAKLDHEQVQALRALGATGASAAELGRRFGVSDTQARNILNGRQWAPEYTPTWPLPSVWLGVSCENQETADERIPLLLKCPAAVHWVSAEPLLGALDLSEWMHDSTCNDIGHRSIAGCICSEPREVHLDWVVLGSESGPGARPMMLDWASSIVSQCRSAGVAVFTKQIANPADRKGGKPEHWPGGDWPREFPA